MNGIKVSGEFLDLFPDTVLDMILKNPIFAEDNIIPGSFSLPIDIPFGDASPKNSRILKNIDVVENNERLREVDADYYYDKVRIRKGKLALGKIIGNKINTNFQFGTSNLENIKSLKLKDIITDFIVLNTNTTYKKSVRLDPELTSPYHIIVNGRPYEESTLGDLVAAINLDQGDAVIAESFGTYIKLTANSAAADIDFAFTVDGQDPIEWTVTPNDEDWNAPVRTALEPYLEPPYPDDRFRFPVIANSSQYEEGYQYFITRMINMSSDGQFKVNIAGSDGSTLALFNPFISQVFTSITPYVMLKYVLDQIAAHYNFEYEGDFVDQNFVAQALIYTPNTLTVKVPFIGRYPFFFLRQSFNLKEFVPDMTVADFFKTLQTRFNLAAYYKEAENKFVLRFRKGIVLSTEYNDITKGCSPLRLQEDIGPKGISLNIEKDSNDKNAVVDQYLLGPQQDLPIKTKCYGLNDALDNAHTAARIPVVDQPFSDGDYGFLRLFFYKGTTASTRGFNYPRAEINPDDFDFTFDGVNGLYQNFWKEYLNFLLRRKAGNVDQTISLAAIRSLDWEMKVMFDRSLFLYDELNISLGMRDVSVSKTALFSV
jgi:hypothetical protein